MAASMQTGKSAMPQDRGNYMVPFIVAGSGYFLALAMIQLVAPKIEPALKK